MWPLNSGHGKSCNLAHFCSEFHSWNSSPSMHYKCRIQITSFSAKNIFSFAKNSSGCWDCPPYLWFCQYFPQRGNKLQRFYNLLCSVRMAACSVGFVLRLPSGRLLDCPTKNSPCFWSESQAAQVAFGCSLQRALSSDRPHRATAKKFFGRAYAIVHMQSCKYVIQRMQYNVYNTHMQYDACSAAHATWHMEYSPWCA